MSLYGDYIKEHYGDDIIETEDGFASYRFTDPSTVYVLDVYVKPQLRQKRVAARIIDSIVEIAKERGCKKLIVTVMPTANYSTDSMKAVLGYGMKLDSSTNNVILFTKEISQ